MSKEPIINVDFTPGKPLRIYNKDGNFKDFSTDELVGMRMNKFKNWKCAAGIENLHIDMDGDVRTASCYVGGKLGNVYTDFNLLEDWVTCTKTWCSCGADLFIPKIKDESNKRLLRRRYQKETEINKKTDIIGEIVASERTHSPSTKQVHWEIGRRCNYDCSYCWPQIHNNYERHKSLEELITATQLIEKKFAKGEKVNFIISGGEPTVNPAFLDWVRYISTFGHHMSLHSNGSRKPDYYRELIAISDVNISVHFEFYNKDRLLEVIKAIVDEKLKLEKAGHLEVKLMMTPQSKEEALEFEKKIIEIPNFTEYCTWAIVPIRSIVNAGELVEGYKNEDFSLFGDRNKDQIS